MRVITSQYEISGKNPICSVKPFSLIEHNYLPETKFIGTSSILGWGKSGVLPTDPIFRLEWFFFHLLFIHVVWEVNWLDVFLVQAIRIFLSGSFAVVFENHLGSRDHLRLGTKAQEGLPTSDFQLP